MLLRGKALPLCFIAILMFALAPTLAHAQVTDYGDNTQQTQVNINNIIQNQDYGNWAKYPKHPGVWHCRYYYRLPHKRCYHYHIMIWYEKHPHYCYLYDPYKRVYWGRWYYPDLNDPTSWQFSHAPNPQGNRAPTQINYTKPGNIPNYPGGKTPMTPPKRLPPV